MEVGLMDRLWKKYLAIAASLFVVLAIISAVTGCQGVNAKEILDSSQKTMVTMTTAKLHLDTNATVSGGPMQSSSDIEEVMNGPEGVKMKMTTEVAGQATEAYIVGGTSYVKMAGRWFKSSVPTSNGGQVGLGSVKDVESAMSNAENPRMVTEDPESYTIAFVMRRDFIENRLNELKAQQGNLAGAIPEITSNEITMKVNKKTKNVTEVTTKMTTHGSQYGDANMESRMTILGYNMPISIEVPPEALNAPTLPAPGSSL
jgi:hypothetical protein